MNLFEVSERNEKKVIIDSITNYILNNLSILVKDDVDIYNNWSNKTNYKVINRENAAYAFTVIKKMKSLY